MKKLTQTFEEILADYQDTKYDIDQKSLEKLIQAVKARDKEVLGEIEEHQYAWDNPKMPEIARNLLRAEIKQKMKDTI